MAANSQEPSDFLLVLPKPPSLLHATSHKYSSSLQPSIPQPPSPTSTKPVKASTISFLLRVVSWNGMAQPKARVAPSALMAMEFTLFPKLPKEVRDEIWDLALPAPRVLKVQRHSSFLLRQSQWGPSPCDIGTSPIATALLHVSQEARAAALRRYEPTFQSLLATHTFYFDYERDSIMFEDFAALEWFYGGLSYSGKPPLDAAQEFQAKIRNIGVKGGKFEIAGQDFIIGCPSLKKLIIALPRHNDGCRYHGIAREMTCIIQRLVMAWKERLQTDDDKLLPVLQFPLHNQVESYLIRSIDLRKECGDERVLAGQ